eukprot:2938890-Pyramimonas_sp.AAC.1
MPGMCLAGGRHPRPAVVWGRRADTAHKYSRGGGDGRAVPGTQHALPAPLRATLCEVELVRTLHAVLRRSHVSLALKVSLPALKCAVRGGKATYRVVLAELHCTALHCTALHCTDVTCAALTCPEGRVPNEGSTSEVVNGHKVSSGNLV